MSGVAGAAASGVIVAAGAAGAVCGLFHRSTFLSQHLPVDHVNDRWMLRTLHPAVIHMGLDQWVLICLFSPLPPYVFCPRRPVA